ncbi:hypothetical protein PRN20_04720 [Devosia sp. ZB163]|uniref:hypothetical protein n=1 Tax=Devosia sp. ZB163 TaxID=3025938 RepID=UPI0023613385|nr:hypothetical protein [Devosia sp. ZB163]MDC9823026.1 hypothetical protein [Devosia sp. ZB163]
MESRLGVAFQMDRMALIQEIARNLVGESPPPTGTTSTGPLNRQAEPAEASPDDVLLAGRLAQPEAKPPGVAGLLAGMKLPQAMVLQPEAYRQVLAQLVRSETAMAALLDDAASPHPPHTAGTEHKPQMPGTTGTAVPQSEAPGEADIALARSINADRDSGAVSLPGLRREAVAATPGTTSTTIADTIADAVAASSEAPASDALASTEAVVERALLSLGLGEGAASPAAMRSELGGIIASFILNAHFQPGWPPLRPVQDPEAKAFVAQLTKDPKLGKDDIALLTYLANFGLNRTQLARILKLAASAANRSKLLESIAHLFANIGTLLGAVHAEIEALAEEIREARAGRTKRERLTLR